MQVPQQPHVSSKPLTKGTVTPRIRPIGVCARLADSIVLELCAGTLKWIHHWRAKLCPGIALVMGVIPTSQGNLTAPGSTR